MPKARSKELVLSYGSTYLYSQKTGYNTMLDIIFQYGREPVLIHRELIGFEGIQGFSYCNTIFVEKIKTADNDLYSQLNIKTGQTII